MAMDDSTIGIMTWGLMIPERHFCRFKYYGERLWRKEFPSIKISLNLRSVKPYLCCKYGKIYRKIWDCYGRIVI